MSPSKTNARIGVPQDKIGASALIANYGALDRDLQAIEIEMNERIAEIKAAAFKKAEPIRAQAEKVTDAIQSYCEANRAALTKDGSTKTVDFGVGKTSWRTKNAKVKVEGDEDQLVQMISNSGDEELNKLLREKTVLNRVAVLNNPHLIAKLAGVEIEKGGETFEIKPDKAKVPDTSKAEAAE